MPQTSLRAWRRGTPTWPATCPRANLRGTNPGILGSQKDPKQDLRSSLRPSAWERLLSPRPGNQWTLTRYQRGTSPKHHLCHHKMSPLVTCRHDEACHKRCHEEPAISAMTYVCRQSSLHIVRTPPSVTTSHVLCHIIHLQNCGLLDKMMLIYLKILLTYISVRPFSHFRLCPPVFPWILCWDESSTTSYHKNQNHQRSHFRRIDSDLQVSCLFLLRKTAYLTY